MVKSPKSLIFLGLLLTHFLFRDGTAIEIQHCVTFNLSSQNNARIKCSLHTELNVTTKCPMKDGENAIQFLGEFGALFMNCTAPFHLDLDYDGFRPTEAIELSIWKNVDVETRWENETPRLKISVKEFGLTVKIWSIQHLFDYIRQYRATVPSEQVFENTNLSRPMIYPRTGKFVIRGLHAKNRDKLQKFYFFFEEPLLENEIAFIDNANTLKPHLVKGENSKSVLIPCRPSHWTKDVSLWYNSNPSFENFTVVSPNLAPFDPTIGFKMETATLNSILNSNVITAEDLKGVEMECRAVSSSGKISKWEADKTAGDDSSGSLVFGLDRLTETRDGGSLRFQNQVRVTPNDQFSLLRCFLDRLPQPNDAFYSFGRPLGTLLELRYNQEMILPIFLNRSYWAQRWEMSPKIVTIFISRANPHGVAFCRKNDTYVYQQYASGLNLKEFTFGMHTQWDHLPRRTTGMKFQIKIEMVEPNIKTQTKRYSHFSYLFYCHNSGFSFTTPILWFVKYKNQTQALVFKDESLKERVSKLRIKLTSDVHSVFCLKLLWDGFDELGEIPKRFWKTASIDMLKILDGTAPLILKKQDTATFPQGSKNQLLTCEAVGDPTPSVWWEKDGQMMTTIKESVEGAVSFEIPVISDKSSGSYICRAKNEYGEAEAKIVVTAAVVARGATFNFLAIGIPIFIIIVMTVLLRMFINYRRKIQHTRLTIQELKEFQYGIDPGSGKTTDTSKALNLYTQRYNKELFEIPEDAFTIDDKKILGSGEFGLVLCANVGGREVAAKTTKSGTDKSHLKSLLSELKVLMYLGNHPHLINLIGASTLNLDKGIVHVFVELCEGGDLLTFLETHREKFFNMSETRQEFKIDQLHSWAIQIANGMDFVSSKNVIHSDLAARNILLTGEKVAKITDLGLSRQLYANAPSSSIYKKKSKGPLPFRWMALEALEDLKFSCESDRWAYGVLLWEMYSLGQVPFAFFRWDPQFIQHLKDGHRLSCPPILPRRLFSAILTPCWDITPENRPNFATIATTLEQMTRSTNYMVIQTKGESLKLSPHPIKTRTIFDADGDSDSDSISNSNKQSKIEPERGRYTAEPTIKFQERPEQEQKVVELPHGFPNYQNEASSFPNYQNEASNWQ